jgi:hypothetical protein
LRRLAAEFDWHPAHGFSATAYTHGQSDPRRQSGAGPLSFYDNDAPNLALPNAMEIFPIYAIFSVIGWIFVGVPQLSLHCRSGCFHGCLGWAARSSVQLWDRSHC